MIREKPAAATASSVVVAELDGSQGGDQNVGDEEEELAAVVARDVESGGRERDAGRQGSRHAGIQAYMQREGRWFCAQQPYGSDC